MFSRVGRFRGWAGSGEFIEKLNGRHRHSIGLHHCFFRLEPHPLYEELKKIKKSIDISGGERQRVSA